MRIIIDGMGGDHAPAEIVKGAVEAAAMIDHEICIVGKQELIEKELKLARYNLWDIISHDLLDNICLKYFMSG